MPVSLACLASKAMNSMLSTTLLQISNYSVHVVSHTALVWFYSTENIWSWYYLDTLQEIGNEEESSWLRLTDSACYYVTADTILWFTS